jgi:hypothetical protein
MVKRTPASDENTRFSILIIRVRFSVAIGIINTLFININKADNINTPKSHHKIRYKYLSFFQLAVESSDSSNRSNIFITNSLFVIFILYFLSFDSISDAIVFTITANVGSYTQGRIAGDFLSSRKAARAERCPPKTTAAALDG